MEPRRKFGSASTTVTKRFVYQKRSSDVIKRRATQSGSNRDGFIDSSFPFFMPKPGTVNVYRILPPTWENAEHYGLEIFVHYNIGVDNSAYLCPNKMKNEDCPICEERKRAEKEGDEDYIKELSPVKRVLIWIIDRNNEKEGPILWPQPWTFDREVCKLSVDSRTGEVLIIDNPENGYDVEFEKEGQGQKTKYTGIKISRHPTPLGVDTDLWLEYVCKHPLPSVLKFYPSEHLQKVFQGKLSKADKEEVIIPSKQNPIPEEVTANDVKNMSIEELEAYAIQELGATKEELSKIETKEELIEAILSNITPEIEKPIQENEPDPSANLKDKLHSMRARLK